MIRLLAIAAGLVVLLVTASCGGDDAEPTPPAGGSLPIGLSNVRPEHGAEVTNDDLFVGQPGIGHGVCAGFDFSAGEGMGDDPISRVTVMFDDEIVTSSVQWETIADSSHSSGTGCYTPPEPLIKGDHEATVRYSDVTDRQFQYTWRFQVSD